MVGAAVGDDVPAVADIDQRARAVGIGDDVVGARAGVDDVPRTVDGDEVIAVACVDGRLGARGGD